MKHVIIGWALAIVILLTLIWWDRVHAAPVYEQSGLAGTIVPQTLFGERVYDLHCVCVQKGDEPDEEVDDCDCTVVDDSEYPSCRVKP